MISIYTFCTLTCEVWEMYNGCAELYCNPYLVDQMIVRIQFHENMKDMNLVNISCSEIMYIKKQSTFNGIMLLNKMVKMG